jgi:SPP1 family predicted phage head-tail adaptor
MPKPIIQLDPLAINAGELRHQVQLCHRNATQDNFGQPVNTWMPYRTTMASIRNLSGQELFQGAEFTSAAQIRVRMRWTDDCTVPGDRILFGARVYVVQICDNVQLRNRVLQLTCLEIDGAS